MPTSGSNTEPPFYILVSHSTNTNQPTAATLTHPVIEYHYADDSPRSLLPQYPGEHVIVLDHDPARGTTPTVKSLSKDLAVTGLRVTDAPGAATVEDETIRNNKMHVLETMSSPEENLEEEDVYSPHAILARFVQRNAVLRRALNYPDIFSGVGQEPVSAVTISPPYLP